MKTFKEWAKEREEKLINENKERRILQNLMKDEGFTLVRESGPHELWKKDDVYVTVGKNVRDAKTLFKKTMRYFELEKQKRDHKDPS
jgi:predicted RNA binding protein YcfA (HicA-like mRNA interferase family)